MVKTDALPALSNQRAVVTSRIGTPSWNRSSTIGRVCVSHLLRGSSQSAGYQLAAPTHDVGV